MGQRPLRRSIRHISLRGGFFGRSQEESSSLEADINVHVEDDPAVPQTLNWTEEFRQDNTTNAQLSDLRNVQITKYPSESLKYEQIKGLLKEFRGPLRLNDRIFRKGWTVPGRRIPSEAEARLLQGSAFERKLGKSKPRWGFEGSRNEEELFHSLKYPNALTQDRVWYEAPRMQMLELRNGTWNDVGFGVLRLHSSMHWERDGLVGELKLKNTRWMELVPMVGRPPIFSSRLNPLNIRFDPTPVRTAVRLNIYDSVARRVRVLAFRQLKRELSPLPPVSSSREPLQAPTPDESEISSDLNSEQLEIEREEMKEFPYRNLELNESHGYHDHSPLQTALNLIEEIQHFVPYILQIPEANEPGQRPTMVFQGDGFRMWRFIRDGSDGIGRWVDWNMGKVEVFRVRGKTALRFLSLGTNRELMAMVLDKAVKTVSAPVKRGVLLSGPAIGIALNVSHWTVVIRKAKDCEDMRHNGTLFEEPNPSSVDTWHSRRLKAKPWHGDYTEQHFATESLTIPSFKRSLEKHMEALEDLSFPEKQLCSARILIHAIQISSKCKTFANMNELLGRSQGNVSISTENAFVEKHCQEDSDVDDSLRKSTTSATFSSTDSANEQSTDLFGSDEGLERQLRDKRKLFYDEEFSGMIPGTHLEKLAREEEKEGEDDVGPV
eukprot:CAMPEP_0184478054 /NCGR_PEP_ID=MMETSP0113_2-20130426/168_1 /TAXON_ID=91329 /ORGANISM="Norrisiella sphaerica, Strain BC52" /LENGTH=662 /DNA_ID=CAMNT_0026855697 /DNA_START=253 /DNA_END=2238 /DNA_ORIENTATION=-